MGSEMCIRDRALADADADVCYHLAWAGVSTDIKNDIGMQMQNLSWLINVMTACRESGCRKIIIPGSASEYAYCGEMITGKNTYSPGDAYAAVKAAGQVLAQWYADNKELDLNWLLIGSVYGPGRNDNNILTYTIKALLNNEKTKFSKLEQMWDYIYIDDLIDALYLVGNYGKPGAVYPVGSGIAIPLREYIEKIKNIIDPEAQLGIGLLPYKDGCKPDNSVLDISALCNDTGFAPKVPFEMGIQKTIQYFKKMENNNGT